MKPIEFREQNKVLSKPSNMTDEECSPLPIFSDGKNCISCWRGSWKERLKFLLYGKVWIYVMSGKIQPPIAIDVNKTVFKRK